MPRKERIIICATCGKEVVTTARNCLRCKECAELKHKMDKQKKWKEKRVMNGENPENDLIYLHDSPEDIQECLNCKKPTCRNCLAYRKEGRKNNA